ncbi:uncharacterized protein LOC121741084 [Salvia splendens]|uniref:uncharacterized protein LOC121741084 n=1 Tax=Salvia splendens TaxID=180675 RepID=UPI001C263723|nr:uncharacterized protein LOC121741084 [Salvia splendens]XP_041989714.1 uncharacterized protein LOC121741084 [Salvia splendens]
MEGETNQDHSFLGALDSPEGSPSSNAVDGLASDGNRHDGSNVGTSNLQEQTFDDDAVPQKEILVRGTASGSLTTSSSASSSDQPSSSSGIGRLLSGRFTFKSNQLVKKLLQNSVHLRVGGIDSRSLSISLHVPSSNQQWYTSIGVSTRGLRLTPLRNLAPRLVGNVAQVSGNQEWISDYPWSTGLSEEQIRGRLKERKHTKERCSICLEDYDEGDDLGILDCKHEFHKSCIEKWLLLKNTCPICIRKALEIE